jgi:dienelactone hydrolase/phage pi2 protein 07
MKAIRLFFILSILLSLNLLAGQDLKSDNLDFLQKITNKTYKPVNLKLSGNGQWAAFIKMYMTNSDTLMIVNTQDIAIPNIIKHNIKSYEFDSTNKLILTSDSSVELLDLNNPYKSIQINNAIKCNLLKNYPLLVLLCKNDSIKNLQIRDIKGNLLNIINEVSDYYISEDEKIYFVVKSSNLYTLKLLNKGSISTIFTTDKQITNVKTYMNNSYLLLTTKNNKDNEDHLYLNLKTKETYSLTSLIEFVPDWIIIKKIPETHSFFLRTLYRETSNNSIVDIWIGKDKNLKKKFQNDIVEKDFLWHPLKGELIELTNDEYNQAVPLGNTKQFLVFNPYELEDYTKEKPLLKLHLNNQISNKVETIDTFFPEIFISPQGKYLLNARNDHWILYNLENKIKTIIYNKNLIKPIFNKKDSFIIFEGNNGLWKYDLNKFYLSELISLKGYKIEILNFTTELPLDGYNFYKNILNSDDKYFIKLINLVNYESSIIQYEFGKIDIIAKSTDENITSFCTDDKKENFTYFKENFNRPPSLYFKSRDKTERKIFQTNINDFLVNKIIMKEFQTFDSDKNKLNGLLYYPINYDSSKTYPLVVHVYKKQNHLKNRYLDFDYSSGVGFNIRILLEKGFFVYLPDIIIKDKGPGLSAIEDLENTMNAISEPTVDKSNSALIGHSFGGFITNFAATHSNFKTYISGAGKSDLIHSFHTFSYDFLFPESARIESHFYNMKEPFSQNKEKYLKNNPIFFADLITAPMLIWTGEMDQNIPSSETMGLYLALKRNNKKTIALFYPNEKHVLKNPLAYKDLHFRILDWLDFHLKNEKNIDWILKEFKEDALSY